MKISIVTVSYNAAKTIRDTLESVASQRYSDIEHILVDGASTDDTMPIVEEHGQHLVKTVSEPDKGLYDAMNKGWQLATGDYVGFLNADDMLADEQSMARVVETAQNSDADCVLGDTAIVDPVDLTKMRRLYSARSFKLRQIEEGFAPPHPGFYARRSLYERFGGYDLDYPYAADFDLIARFLYVNKASYVYLPGSIVRMRHGGQSSQSIRSNLIMFEEVHRSNKNNGIPTSRTTILKRYFRKGRQFFMRAPEESQASIETR